MSDKDKPGGFAARVVCGFIAGFLATLIFHQLALGALWSLGMARVKPFSMAATAPFGMPAVFSLAVWGGVWGILYGFAERAFPRGAAHWITAFLFGAILPSSFALLVVFPLKGLPVGGGWLPPLLFVVFVINGAWGIGAALFLKALFGLSRRA